MSADEPRRLLDSHDLSGLLRGALEAERADTVDDARLQRIAQSIALAGSSAAPPSAPDLPAEPSAGGAAKPAAGWLSTKGPFVLLAAATIGGLVAIGRMTPPGQPDVRPVPAPIAAPAAPLAEEAPPSAPAISPADLPTAPPVLAAPKPARSASTGGSEADEIALLARAHDALRGDPARSLALCKEHEGRFVGGHFAQEREAVAIEALVYLGRKDEARRRWEDFQRRYPSSSHRVHLESLLAAPPAP